MAYQKIELAEIPGLIRCETTTRDEGFALAADMTRAVYSHEQIYGQFCTLQDYIDAPIDEVYAYLADIQNLNEWTYSTRGFDETDEDGLFVGVDTLVDDTKIYMRLQADPQARTLDYHCAWDQGKDLWMVYLIRLIDANVVLNRPGTVLVWTNCHHPNYDKNPYPELAPSPNRTWVGDMWGLFYAGHAVELANLKAILERRHGSGARQVAP
ncbi:SRPBCC family protein [Micromonospora sp. NPDC048935]|uniref:SRPBCC family protein n=1 Tax=Micromonospora sp. NPDC048935 TaxID=3364262 RepID=UPI00371BE617